jgi:hypothetical protein
LSRFGENRQIRRRPGTDPREAPAHQHQDDGSCRPQAGAPRHESAGVTRCGARHPPQPLFVPSHGQMTTPFLSCIVFRCALQGFSTVNFAVSATAITAITPACTGSLTTRSAASGTLPAMFRLITSSPVRALPARLLDLAAHQRSGQHQRLGPGQAGPPRAPRPASACSPTSGIVSTEMCSPRILCRSASDTAPMATCPTCAPPPMMMMRLP